MESMIERYTVHRKWWQRLLGYCPCCGRYFRYPITTERTLTAYVDDSENWLTACKECHRDAYEYYSELWDWYYATRL